MPNLGSFLGGRSPDGFDNPLGQYGFTNEDFVSYVGTAFGEFMNEPQGTFLAGADVIANRLGNPQILGGRTVYEVLTAPNQFDVWHADRTSRGGAINLRHGLEAAFNPTYAARFQDTYNNALFAGRAVFGGPLAVNGYGYGPARGAANGATFWNAGGLSPAMQKAHDRYGATEAVPYGDGRTVFYGPEHAPNPRGFSEALSRVGGFNPLAVKDDGSNLVASHPYAAPSSIISPDEGIRARYADAILKGPDEATRAHGALAVRENDGLTDFFNSLNTVSEGAGKGSGWGGLLGEEGNNFLSGPDLDMLEESGFPALTQEEFNQIFADGFPPQGPVSPWDLLVGGSMPLDITELGTPPGFQPLTGDDEQYDPMGGQRMTAEQFNSIFADAFPGNGPQHTVDGPSTGIFSPEFDPGRGSPIGGSIAGPGSPWEVTPASIGMEPDDKTGHAGVYGGLAPQTESAGDWFGSAFGPGFQNQGAAINGRQDAALAGGGNLDFSMPPDRVADPSIWDGGPLPSFDGPDPYRGGASLYGDSDGYTAPAPSWQAPETRTSSVFDEAGYNRASAEFTRDLAAYNASVNASNNFPATANRNSGLNPTGTLGPITPGHAFDGLPGRPLDPNLDLENEWAGAMKGGMLPFAGFSVPQAAPTASRAPTPGPRPAAPQRSQFTRQVATQVPAPAPKFSPTQYAAALMPEAPTPSFSSGGDLAPGVSYEGSISGRSTNDGFGNSYDQYAGPNWSDNGGLFDARGGGMTDATGKGGGSYGSLSAGGGQQPQDLGAYGSILDQIIAAAAAEAFAGGGGQQGYGGGYADPYGGPAYNDSSGYNYR